MRYHLTLVRMTIIKNKDKKQTNERKQKTTSIGKDLKKLKPLNTVGRNFKWCSLYGKLYGGSSKT